MEKTPRVPIPVGELFDKIAILQLKMQRFHDADKLANVQTELRELNLVLASIGALPSKAADIAAELAEVNGVLWDIEEEIRALDRRLDFGARFIELARSMYKTNDLRATLKKQINLLTASELVEEKSYEG